MKRNEEMAEFQRQGDLRLETEQKRIEEAKRELEEELAKLRR